MKESGGMPFGGVWRGLSKFDSPIGVGPFKGWLKLPKYHKGFTRTYQQEAGMPPRATLRENLGVYESTGNTRVTLLHHVQ